MTGNNRHDETLSPLGRYWDEVVEGRPAGATDVDPALAATVRHLHAHDDAPGAERHFADRLLEDLMQITTYPESLVFELPAGQSLERAGQPRPQALPELAMPLPRWGATQLATVALVLLTLIAAVFANSAGHVIWRQDPPLVLPAIGGTPATPEALATESVFAARVDGLPTAWGTATVIRWTLEAGSGDLVIPPESGVRFFVVESGELTATEAGTAHHLGARDTYITTDPEQEVRIRVVGSEDASLIRGVVAKTLHVPLADPFTQHYEHLLDGLSSEFPGGSGQLVLERLTLPPGETSPPLEARRFFWVGIAEGKLGLTLEGDNLPIGWTTGEEKSVTNMTGMPLPIAPGTLMTLRNAGDDPLILYRMTLTPDAIATPAAGTPAP